MSQPSQTDQQGRSYRLSRNLDNSSLKTKVLQKEFYLIYYFFPFWKDPFTTSDGSEFEQYSDNTHQHSAPQQEQVIEA